MNPWEVLGVEPGSDLRTIKRAYAGLIKKHRPDKDPERFQQIHAAYQALLALAEASSREDSTPGPHGMATEETGAESSEILDPEGEYHALDEPLPSSRSLEAAADDVRSGLRDNAIRWAASAASRGDWEDLKELITPLSVGLPNTAEDPSYPGTLLTFAYLSAIAWPNTADKLASIAFPFVDARQHIEYIDAIESRILVGKQLLHLPMVHRRTFATALHNGELDAHTSEMRCAIEVLFATEGTSLARAYLRQAFPDLPVIKPKQNVLKKEFEFPVVMRIAFALLFLATMGLRHCGTWGDGRDGPDWGRESNRYGTTSGSDDDLVHYREIEERFEAIRKKNEDEQILPPTYDTIPWLIPIRRQLGVDPSICQLKLMEVIEGRKIEPESPRFDVALETLLADFTLPEEARNSIPRAIVKRWPHKAVELLGPHRKETDSFGDAVRQALNDLFSQ